MLRLVNAATTSGAIRFDGADLLAKSERAMRGIRGGRIGMIFQEPMTALNPLYTVGNQIGEVLELHEGMRPEATRARAIELLQHTGIPEPERRVDAYPHQLSGGQRKRAMIAMALACRPELHRIEGIAAGDLPEGPHSLTLQIGEGAVILEGFSVTDSRAAAPPSSWVRLTPLSGTTVRETDFVTVRMNLSELKPWIYTDHVTITSNGGTARIPISLNVTGEPASKILPVYRYVRGDDILFMAQPDREDPRHIGAYQRTGLAFKLYGPQAAGTVEPYRWYNPAIGDHYYAAERSGGRKNLAGYLFEGAIGNIATIRLPGTKELYRWFNPSTNRHFFTTDAAGECQGKKGYRFEGTVGFVL